MSPSDILDPSVLISSLPTYLPVDGKHLGSPQDGLAALTHTAFSVLAFRLTAVNDVAVPSSDNVLPSEWNKNGPGHYSFKYRHDQSSLEFAITVSKLGNRTVINAIALESDKIASLDVPTDDFTSPSFYPFTLGSDASKSLVHGFISSNRVTDFVAQLKLKIIQRLIPGLQKDGYSEGSETTSSTPSAPSSSQNPPPARPRPVPAPDAPDFIPYQPGGTFPSGNPLEIGRSDLDPFPRNPFAPPSLFPPGGGDGMFVGPNHPMFGARDRYDNSLRGPWGGDGYLPPLGAPPGARFDPVGPAFPNRPNRGPFAPGGGRNARDPDNDEFMPPGMRDMFM
ncbi:hypothetical protein FA15DRAFT_632367 [Coprinopsis marcescibilis]|uniref:Uncharacterized protein n=1 Tax=Coprinopsis marcescibilis TaxID=230819 RepID=A0A5C3L8K6_COPMA|nr:hypothetical protein FA15DRAFT_632367 [Coprinopsis marcescibilis]